MALAVQAAPASKVRSNNSVCSPAMMMVLARVPYSGDTMNRGAAGAPPPAHAGIRQAMVFRGLAVGQQVQQFPAAGAVCRRWGCR